MNININDPRLTQYALGEMRADEIKAFENEIKDNLEALEEIEEIRKFSNELEDGFSSGPELMLSETRKEKIKRNAGKVKTKPFNRTLLIKVILTSAAMLFFTAVVFHEEIMKRITGADKVLKKKDYNIMVEMTTIKPHNIPPIPEIPDPPESVIAFEPIDFKRPELEMDPKVTIEDINISNPKIIPLQKILNIKSTGSALSQKTKKHDKYRNILYVNGSVKGYAASSWSKFSGVAILRDFNGDGMITMGERKILPKKTLVKLTEEGFIEDGRVILCPSIIENDSKKQYPQIVENYFLSALTNPLSTFSIDVNSASYANIKRFINHGLLPPANSVRIEEIVNYFSYDYSRPETGKPFSINFEMASCPWQPKHRLVKIGIKGKEISLDKRPASNLVFLLNVSESMRERNKLPLLKDSMKLLLENLNENDRVAIVVYSGSSGLVLPSTTADKKDKIMSALGGLHAGGPTNEAEGIQLAYNTATANFIEGGTNRVILATDGDFNVGTTDEDSLKRLIEKKAKSGVFLSVFGYGMRNDKDKTLEKLSKSGNGNYAYIDTFNEAKKVLLNEIGAKFITIAKDVKVQVEFNTELIEAYRLIGYENRMLKKEDFKDNKKDAGEIGAGHTVTAFYEIVPRDVEMPTPKVDELKDQKPKETVKTDTESSDEFMTVKLRYKEPDGKESKLITSPLKNKFKEYASASDDFKFASSVAAFGMILRNSQHKGNATYGAVLELAEDGLRNDKYGYKKEFITLIKKAQKLQSINDQ